jgi:hypothetical protein
MPYEKLWPEALKDMRASGIPTGNDLLEYKYAAPWQAKTAVLRFPAAPQPEPEIARDAGFVEEREKASSVHALWEISAMTALCRDLGVKRVFGSYDGGGDEGFTHYRGVEMSDGRVIPASKDQWTMADLVQGGPPDIDFDELVESAVCALMGDAFGIGPVSVDGVVIIDFDACTITDEKNADVVLGDRMPWEV